ncbi:MAG: alpha/beta hydrolase [Cellvibrionaceae bacterium]|nr:alpha/beta hydrolase [Cellvibrionaceae bacterium]
MIGSLLRTGPESPLLILAHGAGAPMDSEFMEQMAILLAEREIGVIRFEFPYMAQRRSGGSKRPPDRQPLLLDTWRQVIEQCRGKGKLFVGGKSMGGRMASLVADEAEVDGLVCLGYPFHPVKKPEKLRTEHLYELQTPSLVIQGTRDALGSREEVVSYDLPEAIQLCWLEDGDHDLKPRVKSGYTHQQHMRSAADAISAFMAAES